MDWKRIRVALDGTHHLLEGKPIGEERYDEVLKFHAPGFAPVRRGAEAWHIDTLGQAAYARRFLRTFGFYEERAAVADGDGWHHILPHGSDLYAERYDWCGNFQNGRCTVRDHRHRYGHIDSFGRPIYPPRFRYAGDYRDGKAVVQGEDGRSTHINESGNFVHDRWFLDLDVYHKGFARARDDGGWMHVDEDARPVYTRRFAVVEPFYNGQARVERHDGGIEVIDEHGCMLVELRPAQRSEFASLSADLVGHWRTDTLATAVRLGVMDALPNPDVAMAARCKLPVEKMRRLLRALGELGVVTRSGDGTWHPTTRGEFLQSDHPLTLADAAIEYGVALRSQWQALGDALRIERYRPGDIFHDVLHSVERRPGFHRMLSSYAKHDYEPLVPHFPIRDDDVVVDAGGGTGALAKLVAAKWPSTEVLVVDLPGVAGLAQQSSGRVKAIGADIFEPWPVSADVVLLARVLHDWDDDGAISILKRARAALKPGGRILIVEMVLDEHGYGGGLCDLHLLAVTGGRERTIADFRKIIESAELRLEKAMVTAALPRILVVQP
jgi:hypothetical protein